MTISRLYTETPKINFKVQDFEWTDETSTVSIKEDGSVRLTHTEHGAFGDSVKSDIQFDVDNAIAQATKNNALRFLTDLDKYNRENLKKKGDQISGDNKKAVQFLTDTLNGHYSDPRADIECRTRRGVLPAGLPSKGTASDCGNGGAGNPKIKALFEFATIDGSTLDLKKLSEVRNRLRAVNNDAHIDLYDDDDLEKVFNQYEAEFKHIVAAKRQNINSDLVGGLAALNKALDEAQKACAEIEKIESGLAKLTATYERSMQTKEKEGSLMGQVQRASAAAERVSALTDTLVTSIEKYRLQNAPELTNAVAAVRSVHAQTMAVIHKATGLDQIIDARIKEVEFEQFKKIQRETAAKEVPANLKTAEQATAEAKRATDELKRITAVFSYREASYQHTLQTEKQAQQLFSAVNAANDRILKAREDTEKWMTEMKRLDLKFDDLAEIHGRIDSLTGQATDHLASAGHSKRALEAEIEKVKAIHRAKQDIAAAFETAKQEAAAARANRDRAKVESERLVPHYVDENTVRSLRQYSDAASTYTGRAKANAASAAASARTARAAFTVLSRFDFSDEASRTNASAAEAFATNAEAQAMNAQTFYEAALAKYTRYAAILEVANTIAASLNAARDNAEDARDERDNAKREAERVVPMTVNQSTVNLLKSYRDRAYEYATNAAAYADGAERAALLAQTVYKRLPSPDSSLQQRVRDALSYASDADNYATQANAHYRRASERYELLKEQLRRQPPPPSTPGGGNPDEDWEEPQRPNPPNRPNTPGGGDPGDDWE
ncbi:MAG: hypothetical protein HQM16_08405 [Deltaproteobacteria bacterium]|nr:hypothetical protein [Deltaproteobacteria bacterium]